MRSTMNETLSLEFDRAIRKLGEAFHAWVEAQMFERPWKSAAIDIRFAPDGSSWYHRTRVATYEGAIPLGMSPDVNIVLIGLNQMRRAFKTPWYGIKLEVDSKRKATVTYNHDPNCADDAAFFAD